MSLPVSVTYIVSDLNKSMAFEWIAQYLSREKCRLSFILLNAGDTELEQFLRAHNVPVHRIVYTRKTQLIGAIKEVYRCLKSWKTAVVHTHLFNANVVGLAAARLAGVPKRILTRHHSSLHHHFFPRAVYYDRLTNYLATDIVAISEIVRKIVVDWEAVPPAKVHLIHHGFDLEAFAEVAPDRVKALRDKYGITPDGPVVGIIARQTIWKGIQDVIPAVAELRKQYPAIRLVLANAHGDYQEQIKELLQTQLPPDAYTQIRFESDVPALYQLFDVYVHVPIDNHSEAFGQTYVEALASGIPSVFTLSGVAPEFVRDGENALVVPFQDSEAIRQAIQRLLTDEPLRRTCTENGKRSVQQFALQPYLDKLERLYTQPSSYNP
ncbi:glycosyltransferase family 4 protein [Hymenobacter sp. 102]|uniref:glycosyltransferase family 4 protein n=1 Tax=Hymenobacter sp. 102 TaxID=3403152 RepID=UPI003CF0792C